MENITLDRLAVQTFFLAFVSMLILIGSAAGVYFLEEQNGPDPAILGLVATALGISAVMFIVCSVMFVVYCRRISANTAVPGSSSLSMAQRQTLEGGLYGPGAWSYGKRAYGKKH